jgi:hypothetical protein
VGVPPRAWTPTPTGRPSGLTVSIINTMPPTVSKSQMRVTGGGKKQKTRVKFTIIYDAEVPRDVSSQGVEN